jgi:hypothetical protein
MIIARGLDSEDTKASEKYVRSALSWPSWLEETDKALRRLPMIEPPKLLATGSLIISMMKGKRSRGG